MRMLHWCCGRSYDDDSILQDINQLKSFSMLYLINLLFNCFCRFYLDRFQQASFFIRMDSQRQSTICRIKISSSSRLTRTPYRYERIIYCRRAYISPILYSPSSSTDYRISNMFDLTLSISFSTAALNQRKGSCTFESDGGSFFKLQSRAIISFSMLLNRQQAMQTLFCWSSLNMSRIIWLSVEHFEWFLSSNYSRLLRSVLAYCSFFMRLPAQFGPFMLLPVVPTYSPFMGDFLFFMMYWRPQSSFPSFLRTLGDNMGDPLESDREVLLVLVLLFALNCPAVYICPLLLLLKLNGAVPKLDELRMEFLSPNCGLELGVTPGGQISPVSVMVNSKSSFHSIRLTQSLTNIFRSSFSRVGDILGKSGMLTSSSSSILMSLAMDLLSKGHLPKTIWQRTTPTDQISAFMVQISPLMTSGAIQIGDPSIVWASSLAFQRGLQKPKSAILILPLLSRMLSGLMSRCIMLLRVSILKASTICRKNPKARFSGKGPSFCMRRSSVPPLQYSQTKQKLLAVLSMSMYLTMQGQFCSVDSMLISLTVHSYSLGISRNFQA